MSRREATRSRRRRVERQWALDAGRRALAERPVLGEVIERGATRVLYVAIEADPAWPDPIRKAHAARRTAAVEGRCPCGATSRIDPPGEGRVAVAAMVHEPDCLVADEAFTSAVGRWVLGGRS